MGNLFPFSFLVVELLEAIWVVTRFVHTKKLPPRARQIAVINAKIMADFFRPEKKPILSTTLEGYIYVL